MERILTLQRDTQLSLSKSKSAIDQLTDCFVKGATNTYNPHANYDYLAYLFADLAKVHVPLHPHLHLSLTLPQSPVPVRCHLLHRPPPLRQHPPYLQAPPFHNAPIPSTPSRRLHHPQEYCLCPTTAPNRALSLYRPPPLYPASACLR